MDEKIFYRRHLPHFQPRNAMFFVTFRLSGSLPIETITRLKEEQSKVEKQLKNIENKNERDKKLYEVRKRYFGKFDTLLDGNTRGPLWLKEKKIAQRVADSIHYRDGKVYDLIAYTIMPNHVHTVFTVGRDAVSSHVGRFAESSRLVESATRPTKQYLVTNILGSLKKHTALEANKILKRKGAFWQDESYDHVIRNARELERIVWYVLNNPVKPGFVDDWTQWKWSYYVGRDAVSSWKTAMVFHPKMVESATRPTTHIKAGEELWKRKH